MSNQTIFNFGNGSNNKNKDVSKLIKELRDKLDLTQEQFAQKVEVTLNDTNLTSKIDPPHPYPPPRRGVNPPEIGGGEVLLYV